MPTKAPMMPPITAPADPLELDAVDPFGLLPIVPDGALV